MESITTNEVQKILASMYQLRDRMIPCFLGSPGIGKTEGVRRFAEEQGIKVVEFILSNTIPSEVSGMRMPDKDTKKMEVFDDLRMASLEDGDILFFDEILEAPDILKSACLTLLQSRIMASGRPLPDVMIVAASNPVGNPANLPASFRDRFVFFDVVSEYEEWAKWMYTTRHIRVNTDLFNQTQAKLDEGYNVLSPRKLTSLIDWCSIDDTAYEYVKKAYGQVVGSMIYETLSGKESVQDRVVRELSTAGLIDEDQSWKLNELSLAKLLEALQALPEWPQIEEALAGLEE